MHQALPEWVPWHLVLGYLIGNNTLLLDDTRLDSKGRIEGMQ